MNHEDINELFETHWYWKKLPLKDLLEDAEECLSDGCISNNDFKMIKEWVENECKASGSNS